MTNGLERQQQEADGSILQASSSGGLNVMSSQLSIPLTDLPSMKNCDVTTEGNIAKRRGTEFLESIERPEDDKGLTGTALIPLKLKDSPNVAVAKVGTGLRIYSFEDIFLPNKRKIPNAKEEITFDNVWSERARYVKPDYVYTAENVPRIIFTTGVNTVVQLSIVQSFTFERTVGSGTTSIKFANSNLRYADATNILVFKEKENITSKVGSVSFGGDELTVVLGEEFNEDERYSVVYFSWQWWAEASGIYGNKLYQRVSRFNSEETDKFVEIPKELLDGIQPLLPDGGVNPEKPRYPLIPKPKTRFTDNETFDYTLTPQTETEYLLTSGGFFNVTNTSDDEVNVGLQFIGFGDIDRNGSGDPSEEIEEVHINRGLPVFFNGTRGVEAQNLDVFVGDEVYVQNTDFTTGFARTYFLKGEDPSTYHDGAILNNNTQGTYIDFTAQVYSTVSSTAFVSATNTEINFIGSEATNAIPTIRGVPRNKFGIPCYGMWEFCDFQEGSFPRTVSLFRGRLVFGGTPKQPLKVAISEVYDTLEVGENFADFQTLLNDNAIIFDVTGGQNEEIRAIEQFNNNLFIFTNQATYRLQGGEAGLTPQSFSVQLLFRLGAVNAQAVQRVENSLYFLSQSGLFDLTATDKANEYASGELSIKVRDIFKASKFNEAVAWMMYDQREAKLYVALSSDREQEKNRWTAERLMVYNTFRDTWTQYGGYSGRWYVSSGAILETEEEDSIPVMLNSYFNVTDDNGSPSRASLIQFEAERPVDRLVTETLTFDESPNWTRTINFENGGALKFISRTDEYFYPTAYDRRLAQEQSSSLLDQIFELIPHRGIKDVRVSINYEGDDVNYFPLTFGEDYEKVNQGIFLTGFVPTSGNEIIKVEALSDPEDDNWVGDILPMRFWLDNRLLVQGVDYEIELSNSTGKYEVTFLFSANAKSVLEYGFTYPAWFYSPKFFRGDMGNVKRFLHWHGYFNNKPYQEVYSEQFLNDESGQTSTEIIGTYRLPVGFTVAFNYNDTGDGYVSDSDIYGSQELFWDDAFFGLGSPSNQFNKYARISESLIGASYNFQVGLFVNRATYFDLVGYQVDIVPKGRYFNLANNTPRGK